MKDTFLVDMTPAMIPTAYWILGHAPGWRCARPQCQEEAVTRENVDSAGVVQWQNTSFPSSIRGFDSPHPLHRSIHRAVQPSHRTVARSRPGAQAVAVGLHITEDRAVDVRVLTLIGPVLVDGNEARTTLRSIDVPTLMVHGSDNPDVDRYGSPTRWPRR